jgi:hypothetical protein
MISTLQAQMQGTIALVIRHGDVADCPIFTKWIDYPPEILAGLEYLTPFETDEPCSVEILFSDLARPNPTGDGFEIRLNRLLIPVAS